MTSEWIHLLCITFFWKGLCVQHNSTYPIRGNGICPVTYMLWPRSRLVRNDSSHPESIQLNTARIVVSNYVINVWSALKLLERCASDDLLAYERVESEHYEVEVFVGTVEMFVLLLLCCNTVASSYDFGTERKEVMSIAQLHAAVTHRNTTIVTSMDPRRESYNYDSRPCALV